MKIIITAMQACNRKLLKHDIIMTTISSSIEDEVVVKWEASKKCRVTKLYLYRITDDNFASVGSPMVYRKIKDEPLPEMLRNATYYKNLPTKEFNSFILSVSS